MGYIATDRLHNRQVSTAEIFFPDAEGLFEPTVMFFGLMNSPATFQMMMNTIF